MIELIKPILEHLGKYIWLFILGTLLAVALIFSFTFTHPISFKISSCTQRDETYQLHNTTYVVKSVVEQSGGASLKVCIKEVYKTVKNNLVEK